MIGSCLTLIHLFLIPVTNASVNPARSTGPALFGGGAIGQLWLFWLAPMLGAALAGVVGRWQHELVDIPGRDGTADSMLWELIQINSDWEIRIYYKTSVY